MPAPTPHGPLADSRSTLLVGCGTGADFEFLPQEVQVTAVDLTPAMLRRAAARVGDRHIRLLEMDAICGSGPDRRLDPILARC